MFKKVLIAAAALAAVGFAASAPANAKVNVDLYFNGGGWGPGYYGYYQPRPHHQHYHGYKPVYVKPHWGISCGQGRNTVDWSGYNNVKTIECQGTSYTYRATRHGKGYVVKVGRNSGNIIGVNRVW